MKKAKGNRFDFQGFTRMNFFSEKSCGFTLIELLVVIAIIGMLSSIVFASLNTARMKGRDARRISEVKELQKALELFYDANGRYPDSGWVGSHQPAWETGVLGTALQPYLPKMPVDPLNTSSISPGYAYNGNYNYSYFGTAYTAPGAPLNQWYMIIFTLENKNLPLDLQNSSKDCVSATTNYRNYGGNDGYIITLGGNCTF